MLFFQCGANGALLGNSSMEKNWKDYLKTQGVSFDSNTVICFPKDLVSSTKDESNASFCIIDTLSVASITGSDSKKFLQGQLTCNLETLSDHQHTLAAACTPKGKTYSNFRLLQASENTYLLAPHRSIIDPTLEKLNKYAIFYQTTLDKKENHLIFGLMGTHVEQALSLCVDKELIPKTITDVSIIKNSYLLKTNDLTCNRFELWIHEDDFVSWWQILSKHFTPTLQKKWNIQNILSVIPWITASSVEKYIPQELNLTSLGFVSFRKGCYTGQEIIARVQNLGVPKSRTYAITYKIQASSEEIILQDSVGKKIGHLLDYETLENQQIALANIRINAVENEDVFLNIDTDATVKIKPIPYIIDPTKELLV